MKRGSLNQTSSRFDAKPAGGWKNLSAKSRGRGTFFIADNYHSSFRTGAKPGEREGNRPVSRPGGFFVWADGPWNYHFPPRIPPAALYVLRKIRCRCRGQGATSCIPIGPTCPSVRIQRGNLRFRPIVLSPSELSWVAFTLVRTVPPHIDKPDVLG
jgi:hypothetical protein